MDLKNTLKKIPMLHASVRFLRQRITDCKAILRLLSGRTRRQKGAPIKVAFICQYIPAWSKVKTVYELMKKDPRFQPYLICLPSDIHSAENDTYKYFCTQGYENTIDALIGQAQWLDMKSMGFSYVIYNRPYNDLMPPPFSSTTVSQYSRVCLLMYGMAFSEEDSEIALNRDFLSNTYFYFAETEYSAKKNIQRNKPAHSMKLQKTLCLGMPVMDAIAESREQISSSWDFSKNDFRVLWTPRWTTDPKVGGTNFFTYAECLLDFAAQHPDIDFLFRPHPLMFNHFIETGEMTLGQVSDYQARCEALPNVAFDRQSEYDATLWGSDVLVSDISGIMPEFLFTGKPLIFCATNMQLQLLEPMEKLLTGCYVVNNEQELFARLLALQAGDDPLAQTRRTVVSELFGNTQSPSAAILEQLAQDAQS